MPEGVRPSGEDLARLRALHRTAEGEALLKYLAAVQAQHVEACVSAADAVAVYRSQGAARAIGTILSDLNRLKS